MDKNGKVKLGLIGLGTVGTGVVKVLKDYENIEITRIAVKNLNKKEILKTSTNLF